MAKKLKVEKPKMIKTDNTWEGEKVTVIGNIKVTPRYKNQNLKTFNIKNNGTFKLFYGLALMLRGSFTNASNISSMSDYIPTYLNVGTGQSEAMPTNEKLEKEVLNKTRFPIIPSEVSFNKIENSASLTLTALVEGPDVTNIKLYELGLFSSITPEDPTLLARSLIKEGEIAGKEIDTGYSWFIEWTITFKNV